MTPEEERAREIAYARQKEKFERETRSANGPVNAEDLDPVYATGERRMQ